MFAGENQVPDKKKLIHVITRLDTGGSAELALLVCRRINLDKYDVLLAYGHTPSVGYDISGIPSVHVPCLIREISPVKDLLSLISLYKIFRNEKPDIIQTNSSKAGFVGRWAAWLYNLTERVKGQGSGTAKIIHMPHGHVFYGYGFGCAKILLLLMLERITAKITDILIAITEGERIESLAYGIGKPEQWVIINPGVKCPNIDPLSVKNSVRSKLGIPVGAVVIGTVARHEPVKGIIYLVEAAGLMKERSGRDIVFLIVGDGNLRKDIETRAASLGVKDRIIFTGMRDDVPEMMCAMDIFAQPSLNEGMGKTLVLAHALGLPIVATRVQGIPDVVIDGKTGYLVPPADAGFLAEKLLELTGSPELRDKMGKAGKQHVTKVVDGMACFSEERSVHLFEKLYENISK